MDAADVVAKSRHCIVFTGSGDVLRLSEEGIAFVKYLAEGGHVKIVSSSPYVVKPI
jgi:hypothetical protein